MDGMEKKITVFIVNKMERRKEKIKDERMEELLWYGSNGDMKR